MHAGNLVLVQALERTWNYYSATFHDGIQQLRTCWPIVYVATTYIGREDFLTEAAAFWNQHKLNTLPQSL